MPISSALDLRRTRVWLRRRRLDEQLACGASPTESDELRRRAAQLASPAFRRSLAGGLERVLEAASEPRRGLSSRVPLARHEIRTCAQLVHEVAGELRYAEHVNPRGVAMAEQLLSHGDSPLYAPQATGVLAPTLRHIRAALLLA